MSGAAGIGMVLSVALFLLGLVVAILWICMPFAIFGTKPLLRELLAEQRKTNQYLAAAAERAKVLTPVVAPASRAGDPT